MRLLVALLCSLFCASPVLAADARPGSPEWRAEMKALRSAAAPDASGKVVRTNPNRSYPPSCLSNPLPTTIKGPVSTVTMSIADVDGNDRGSNGQSGYFENVTVRVWRVACSNGKSAVLVGFDRAGAKEQTLPAPDVPDVSGIQPARNETFLRIVAEPNTWQAYEGGDIIYFDQVYVLELLPGFPFDLNAAFTLYLDTIANNQVSRTTVSVPAYNPATNPDAALALEITGYQAGSWYDTAHGGEGILFDVGERADGTRFAFFAWFTYAPDGRPTWIIGNVDVPLGVRTIQIPAFHFSGGGFAGNFNPANIVSRPWGNVRFTFQDCNTLALEYVSTHSDPNVPTGDGTKQWTRLSSINGFVCQ